jgi:hypothetical protein
MCCVALTGIYSTTHKLSQCSMKSQSNVAAVCRKCTLAFLAHCSWLPLTTGGRDIGSVVAFEPQALSSVRPSSARRKTDAHARKCRWRISQLPFQRQGAASARKPSWWRPQPRPLGQRAALCHRNITERGPPVPICTSLLAARKSFPARFDDCCVMSDAGCASCEQVASR